MLYGNFPRLMDLSDEAFFKLMGVVSVCYLYELCVTSSCFDRSSSEKNLSTKPEHFYIFDSCFSRHLCYQIAILVKLHSDIGQQWNFMITALNNTLTWLNSIQLENLKKAFILALAFMQKFSSFWPKFRYPLMIHRRMSYRAAHTVAIWPLNLGSIVWSESRGGWPSSA